MPPADKVIRWPDSPEEQRAVTALAARVLADGGLVVYPTDTVYGLGADPSNARSLQRIFVVKGRPDEKAIIWLVESTAMARRWCTVDARAERLTARYWPGGLTLVLRRIDPRSGGLPTLGVRVPAHPAALAIIHAAGGAVATTSANRSGEPSARTASEAAAAIGAGVDLIVDGGPSQVGAESTVLDLTVDPPAILRAGAVDSAEALFLCSSIE
ncbi:MAG: hypothetical protein HW416_244 [Chloroflexi bacterium]|nr:hypothetical protein [Chloroflexota bacterium]